MDNDNGLYGLVGKLVWPIFIVVLLIIFSSESGE